MDKGGWPWGRKYLAPGAAGAAGSKPLPTLHCCNHLPLLPSGLGGPAAHPSLLGPGKSLGSGELLMGKRNGGEGREVGHKSASTYWRAFGARKSIGALGTRKTLETGTG